MRFSKKSLSDFSKLRVQIFLSFFKLEFTPCKTEQPLRGMELQEKEVQKYPSIQEIRFVFTDLSNQDHL